MPRSQQPLRQWAVGNDYARNGFKNYRLSNDPGSHGRYYEFVNDRREKKVVVLHTNDPNRGIHAHAGTHKGAPDDPARFTYDFKEERYAKINDPKTKDHHLDIDTKCKR
ncbi:HNH/endonuclease VII fold putative polymorphic toxin [Lysinibacillus telephonicus]